MNAQETLAKMVLVVGRDNYLERFGHEPTIAELGELWLDQKVGEFMVQMFIKCGFFYTVSPQNEERIATMHDEISQYVTEHAKDHYKFLTLRYVVERESFIEEAYYQGALRAFLPYALKMMNEQSWVDLRIAMCYSDPQDMEMFQIAVHLREEDYPLYSKNVLSPFMELTTKARAEGTIEQVVGCNMHFDILWVDAKAKIEHSKHQTIQSIQNVIANYYEGNPARVYFEHFLNQIESSTSRGNQYFGGMGMTPDQGVLDMITLLGIADKPVSEIGIPGIFKAIDEMTAAHNQEF